MEFPRILPGSQSLLLGNVQRGWWLDRMLKAQHNHRMARSETGKGATSRERRKLIAFDEETWHALNLLARDSMSTLQELADEAFRDLLRKHNRPVDLKTALRESARAGSGQEPGAGSKRK
jgi:hypothetical protein